MGIASKFENFIYTLRIPDDKIAKISDRYKQITKRLNNDFWNKNSEKEHSLYVGSYGRDTETKTSDIDMLFWLPYEKYSQYSNYSGNGQSALLQDVKESIRKTYSQTDIRADGQVIVVDFSDGICFEVVPCFENNDGSFIHPNSNNGGSWKRTDPIPEIKTIKDENNEWNKNLKRLCRMARAWKDEFGVPIGGLLIDTLAHNFLENWEYKNESYSCYHWMIRDFFEYLKNQNKEQKYWHAVGSNQKIYRKGKFESKAQKAYYASLEAIEYEDKGHEAAADKKWKEIFGTIFLRENNSTKSLNEKYRNTEEFIENKFDIDIRFDLEIDCNVTQNGFRPFKLLNMLARKINLLPKKKLEFEIIKNTAVGDYDIYWKVLNRGDEAKKRDEIRGQIIKGDKTKIEHTKFKGNHLVECYIVQNNVVVARDRIDVPIIEE
ncbi:nucleotide-binding domain-containing protein [Campylobacter curvus]|uniref:nucleotide-binding domain-containing protein n=1 Tax=Campylobacter curvus TaxID=200 RepID=UPI00146FE09E|nr:nucleotidyltransferase [Campylobacter curvus]